MKIQDVIKKLQDICDAHNGDLYVRRYMIDTEAGVFDGQLNSRSTIKQDGTPAVMSLPDFRNYVISKRGK